MVGNARLDGPLRGLRDGPGLEERFIDEEDVVDQDGCSCRPEAIDRVDHLEAGARARKQESSSRSEVVHDLQYRGTLVATSPATTRIGRDDHARQVSRRLALG